MDGIGVWDGVLARGRVFGTRPSIIGSGQAVAVFFLGKQQGFNNQ